MLPFLSSREGNLGRAWDALTDRWSLRSVRNLTFAIGAGALIGLLSLYSPWLGLIFVVGVVFALASLSQPMVLAYTLIGATVLTSGMPRGTIVPLLRPNEAAIALVAGLSVPTILFSRKRAHHTLRLLDIAMVIYIFGVVLAPTAIYLLRGVPLSQSDIMTLVAPIQYVLIYLIFSYLPTSEADRRRLVLLLLAGGTIVAIIGLLQAARVDFVVDFLNTWYPSSHLRQSDDYNRVTSIVSGWNVFGMLMMINLLIVRSLFLPSVRLLRGTKIFVWVAGAITGAALLASGSFAGIIGLGIGLLIIGRFDKQDFQRLLLLGVLLALAGVALWPVLADRIAFQYRGSNSIIPQTLLYRFELWEAIFIPAVREHGLLGLKPDFSDALDWGFAESQYFYLLLRSGVVSLAGHLLWVFLALLWLYDRITGNRGLPRSFALSAAAILIIMTIAGLTNSVFSFSGAIDYLWILLGIVASRERPV